MLAITLVGGCHGTTTVPSPLDLDDDTDAWEGPDEPGDPDTELPTEPVTFVDVTREAGVEHVQHGQTFTPGGCFELSDCFSELMSGGAAAGDFDGDGWVDLYVTRLDGPDLLYRNAGDGTFVDVAPEVGLDGDFRTNGAAWIDVDNDADLDLYVTTISEHRYLLYINDGRGHFTEEGIDRAAAIENDSVHVGNSVAVGDYDGDGWLDLHVTEWRPVALAPEPRSRSNARLLRNLGQEAPGHFEDVTDVAGVALERIDDDGDNNGGFSFSSTFVDLDGDARLDLAVVADFGQSRLFWNRGDGTFIDGTEAAGVGLDRTGMGSTFGDYDADGDLDWFVSAIYEGPGNGNKLYRYAGGREFVEEAARAGVEDGLWGWGAVFFDFDNDADLDLTMTNGMFVSAPGIVPDEPMRLWVRDGDLPFVERAAELGMTDMRAGKGLLTFDYDDDGDLDVFVVNSADTPVLYRNDGGNDMDWLRVRVRTADGRDELNAVVTVVAERGQPAQVRHLGVSSHFLGQSEPVAHFGLGTTRGSVAEVRVRWPHTETVTKLRDVQPNQTLVITP